MVLADAEHVEADLVGELDLLDQVPQALRRVAAGGFAECVDADFH
jgi:hypothetical protein